MTRTEIVFTLTHAPRDGGQTVYDYVLGPGTCGWLRTELDDDRQYQAMGEIELDEIVDELGPVAPAALVVELQRAAAAIGRAASRHLSLAEGAAFMGDDDAAEDAAILAQRARLDRLLVLETVLQTCEAHAPRTEEAGEFGSRLRSIALMRDAAETARRLIEADYPDVRADEPRGRWAA